MLGVVAGQAEQLARVEDRRAKPHISQWENGAGRRLLGGLASGREPRFTGVQQGEHPRVQYLLGGAACSGRCQVNNAVLTQNGAHAPSSVALKCRQLHSSTPSSERCQSKSSLQA